MGALVLLHQLSRGADRESSQRSRPARQVKIIQNDCSLVTEKGALVLLYQLSRGEDGESQAIALGAPARLK